MDVLFGCRPARLGSRVTQLLRVWQGNPAALAQIDHLLSSEDFETAPDKDQEVNLLKKRIADFDADNSLVALVGHALDSLDRETRRPSLPSRQRFDEFRQTLLENVYLPGEDEVAWGSNRTLHGIDCLSSIEHQRRDDVEAIARALKITGVEDLQFARQIGHESAMRADRVIELNTAAKELYTTVFLGVRICVITHHLVSSHPSIDQQSGETFSRHAVLQLLNALFPPYILRYPNELVDFKEILELRERIYIYLMRKAPASNSSREIFQTKLLATADLGGWSGHIRQSLSDYFDIIEKTRRLYSEVLTPPPTPPLSATPCLPPKSILKSHRKRRKSFYGKDDLDSICSELAESKPDRPGGDSKISFDDSKMSADKDHETSAGDFVTHPALRNLKLNLKELADVGLALPREMVPERSSSASKANRDSDASVYSTTTSPEKTSSTVRGESPATGSTEELWPPPLRVQKPQSDIEAGQSFGGEERPATPAYLQDTSSTVDSSLSISATETSSQGTMSRLRSGWKSAESLFSRFRAQEPREPPSDAEATPRPSTALSHKSTSKSVRFSDENQRTIEPAKKKSRLNLFSQKKLQADTWLYARAYQIEKAAADMGARECRLPAPDQRWQWTTDENPEFSIKIRAPRIVSDEPIRLLPNSADVGNEPSPAKPGVQNFIEDLHQAVETERQNV